MTDVLIEENVPVGDSGLLVDVFRPSKTDGPAPALPPEGAALEVVLAKSGEGISNTGAADLTGHPAISVPCGTVDGLPVGAMFVGSHWDESTLYRISHALEQTGAG